VAGGSRHGRSGAGKEVKRSTKCEGDEVLFRHTYESGLTAASRPRRLVATTATVAPQT
jgi:hypothetical protein